MVTSVFVKVDGLRALGERMRKLQTEVAVKAARSATAAASGVIRRKAKANVKSNPSYDTGSLHEAIISKRLGKNQTDLTSEHIVTVRGRGKKKKGGGRTASAPHAHLVEFGTVNMPAEPYLRPAFDSGKEEAARALENQLRKRIQKAGA